MPYIIRSDYTKSIQDAQLAQITGGDNNVLLQAEGAALSRVTGMLVQKYDLSGEFTSTQLYSTNTIYSAADRVYINYPAYNSANSYVIGNYCVYSNSAYVCTTDTTGTFNPSHWASIGTATSIYYAAYPYAYFNLYGVYVVGDYTFYKGRTYKAKQPTASISNFVAVQYGTEDNVPTGNVFPDDTKRGAQWWEDMGVYTVPSNLLASAAYDREIEYNYGDHAQFQGSIYTCINEDGTTGQFDPASWRVVWVLGDNRDALMVTSIIDITLWYIHKRIAPNNIPDLRMDAYNVAIEWLRKLRDGIEQCSIPLIQPKQGRRILSDSIVRRNNYY